MATIHCIFNAHIDPIWLWPWQATIDEAIATCRSACDRLDAHPDFVFSQGEGWIFQQLERCDPALFQRCAAHIRSGRWEVVNGWWVQPDCNLPSGWGFERQIAVGLRYFAEKIGGVQPRVGYNIDSFGHAATLPGYMRAAGQDRYVMMRPQEHEMRLPARLFRWRGFDGGPEVTTFRIAGQYNSGDHIWPGHIERALTELPAGCAHTMVYLGLGDHGGGVTERQIEWVRAHKKHWPEHELVFSTPTRFFDAIAAQKLDLPLVTGELQHHAIGCFTVHRKVKTGLRRAEHLLRQAEIAMDGAPALPGAPEWKPRLEEAWQKVAFVQFHDTMGGTCLPSAYAQVDDQLGFANAIADEAVQQRMRVAMNDLPADPLQRIVAWNPSDQAFDGWLDFEPWLHVPWDDGTILDERGAEVPFQRIAREALTEWGQPHLLFRLAIPAGGRRVLQLKPSSPPKAPYAGAAVRSTAATNQLGVGFDVADGRLLFGTQAMPRPRLDLLEDPSDTWTHRLDRYLEGPAETARWNDPAFVDYGPLMASAIQTGTVGQSLLKAEWRVHAGDAWVELRLTVHWLERQKILKLTMPFPAPARERVDGIPGHWLTRPNTGRELPLRDFTINRCEDGQQLAVICPDVYALDATPERLRLSLLRSAVMAHHEPHLGHSPRGVVSDQGVHEFRFRFQLGKDIAPAACDANATGWQRAPLCADLTRGMPTRTG